MAHIENSLGNITFNEFQDNIDIVKYISTIENVSLEDLVDVLNNIDSFTISEIQSLWVVQYVYKPSELEFTFDLIQINKFKVINKGKGTYGLDGIDLTVDDLFPISSTSINLEDIENNPQTQIYTINDLEGLTVSQYINQLDPAFEFQDVSIAPRLIKVTQIGFEADYLFLPPGGVYGQGQLQTTDSDFQILNENSSISDATKEDKVSGVIAFGTNDYTATVPEVPELLQGFKVLVTFQNTNTISARTLNVNGLGAFAIAKNYSDPLAVNDLKGTMWLMFDTANWVVVGSINNTASPPLSDETFETVSKNLKGNPYVLNYTAGKLTSIVYTVVGGTITKTLNYTGEKLNSLVLSGSTPNGINLTKTLSYTGDTLTNITYS